MTLKFIFTDFPVLYRVLSVLFPSPICLEGYQSDFDFKL